MRRSHFAILRIPSTNILAAISNALCQGTASAAPKTRTKKSGFSRDIECLTSGHGFSRAENANQEKRLQPLRARLKLRAFK
jgi:hypothetical protein